MTNTKMILHQQKPKETSPAAIHQHQHQQQQLVRNGYNRHQQPNSPSNSSLTTNERSANHSQSKEMISISNSISHNISLHSLNIEDEFDVIKTLAEGCFAKIILVKKGLDKMILKAIHCEISTEADFRRELNYNYFLSPHPNIVTSYNVSFIWDNCYVFVQEYAPFGDLSRFVKKGGLLEEQVKLVASQLSSALDFMHGLHLVHSDLKLENILVYKTNLSVLKVCDFGCTYAEGSLVTKTNQTWIPFSPPEICSIVFHEKYYCQTASDVWQVGIIIFVCLTGDSPWNVADITDTNFCQYTDWLRRKSLRMPESFNLFTPRFIRLLKRLLEPKPSKRYEIREIMKYLNDKWIRKSCKSGDSTTQQLALLDRKESMNTSSSSRRQNKSNLTNASTPNPANDGKDGQSASQHYGRHLHVGRRHLNGGNGSFRHTRSKSCRRSLKVFGIETEIDKNVISERVIKWISNNNNNNNSPDDSKLDLVESTNNVATDNKLPLNHFPDAS